MNYVFAACVLLSLASFAVAESKFLQQLHAIFGLSGTVGGLVFAQSLDFHQNLRKRAFLSRR